MAAAREVYTVADLRDWPAATAGISPRLRLAVFGDPVAHSASPAMHNAALAVRRIHARYTRIHVRPEELAEALQLVAQQDFIGVNLTIPHKPAAMALVDAVDGFAARLGAINTVRVEGGGAFLRGFNTDAPGFARAVESELGARLGALRVLVLGAGGGAGRAIALQCAAAGCPRLLLVNRTPEKARSLADALRGGPTQVETVPWEQAALRNALAEIDLVVNTSALGLKPGDASPLPANLIPPSVQLFDTVYRASGQPTPLEAAAQLAGARAIGGRALLLHQGALSFEYWFGGVAPLEQMRHALHAATSPPS